MCVGGDILGRYYGLQFSLLTILKIKEEILMDIKELKDVEEININQ